MQKLQIHSGNGLRINKKGMFNLQKVSNAIKRWFKKNKYTFHYKDNTIKNKDKGVEVGLKFFGARKIDGYVKLRLEVEILACRIKKVKLEKETLDNGTIECLLKCFMILDYKNEYERNILSKTLHKIHTNYIGKKKIDSFYGGKAVDDLIGLQDAIKEVLELY